MSENESLDHVRQIAHSIKNTLAVITMRCDECLKNTDLASSVRNNLEQIKIAVESVKTFTQQLSPQTQIDNASPIQSKSVEPVSDTIPKKETILVADDEPQLRRLICSALRDSGYNVIEAVNGAKALDLFRQNPNVDMIITDMTMPEMGGRDFVRNAINIKSDVKVVYLSGYDNEEINSQSNFLEKPFSRNALLEKVKSILNSR